MCREPTVMGRKLTQINSLDQKEEINIQAEQEFKKNEERLRKLQGNFKHSDIRITGVP